MRSNPNQVSAGDAAGSFWLALLLFGLVLPGFAQPAGPLEQWRADATRIGELAENDAPRAYDDVQRWLTKRPAEATYADQARGLNLLARIQNFLALTGQAQNNAQLALNIARDHGDRLGEAEAELNFSRTFEGEGRIDASLDAATRSVSLLEGSGRPDLLGEALERKAVMHFRSGATEATLQTSKLAMDLAQRIGDPRFLALAHSGMGTAFFQSGLYPAARDHFLRMREHAQPVNSKLLQANAIIQLGTTTARLGDHKGAEALTREALDLYRAVGLPHKIANALHNLGHNLRGQGRSAEALPCLDEAIAIFERYPQNFGYRYVLSARSATHLALGNVPAALVDAEEGYAVAEEMSVPPSLSDSARYLAAAAAAAGDHQRAYELSLVAADATAKADRQKIDVRVIELEKRYASERKQREIDQLNLSNQRQAGELRQRAVEQRSLWLSLAGCATALAAAVYFLARIRRTHHALAQSNAHLSVAKRELEVAEVTARTSRERLAQTFATVAEGIVVIDRTGSFVDSNPTASRILSVPDDQIRASSVAHPPLPTIQEDGNDLPADELPGAITLSTGRCLRGFVHGVRKLDGTIAWLSVNSELLRDEQGSVDTVVVSFSDITQRRAAELALRESEERFRLAFDLAGIGMAMVAQPQRRYLRVNRTFAAFLGYTEQELLGQSVDMVSPPDDHDRTMIQVKRLLAGVIASFTIEKRFIHREGRILWGEVTMSLVRDAEGKPLHTIAQVADITARKAAEEALRVSRERLATIFNVTEEGFLLFDAVGNVVECNAAMERIFGLTREQVLDPALRDPQWTVFSENGREYPPTDHPALEVLRTGVPRRADIACVHHPDGRRTWISSNDDPVRDAAGRICGAVASITDITTPRAAALALRESRERLATIFETVADGIMLLDHAGIALECNTAAATVFGVTPGEAIGKNVFQGNFRVIDVDGGGMPPERWPAAIALRTGETQPRASVLGIHRKDGVLVWISLNVDLIRNAHGSVTGAVCSFTDITNERQREAALRESEERFRQAFEFAGVGMAIIGLDCEILRVNSALCAMLGYTAEQMLRLNSEDYTHADDHTSTREDLQSLVQGRSKFCRVQQRFIHGDGHTLVSGLLTASLVHDAHGRPLHFICQVEDITEQKKLEAELRAARDQALEASRHKSEFVANMSHEIRTPMNGILGTAEVLAATALNATQREMSRVILQSAEALLTIIDDILDLSKIEAGKLDIGLAELNPKELIDNTVALMAPLARQKGLEFECDVEAVLDSVVQGDPVRIRQVLINLLGNAIKFTLHGQVIVTARAAPAETDNRTLGLVVSVRDTGIGIAGAAQANLFQPFVQAAGGQGRQFGGTGLGLVISRHLVELMGGLIGFTSEAGQGSTFWFKLTLPRRALGDTPSLRSSTTSANLAGAGESPSEPRRLLVVEDNAAGRFVARMQLEHLGHTVDFAENGFEALERLAAQTYDAVLMDCDMPGLDGYETTRRIRSGSQPGVNARVLIIALTAYAMPADRARCLAAGMDDYIAKPLKVESLRRALARHEASHPQPEANAPAIDGEELYDRKHLAQMAKIPAPNGQPLSNVYVAMFLGEIPARLAQFAALIGERKSRELAHAAHSLAGSAANLAAKPLRAALKQLETTARAEDWTEASVALAAVEAAWDRLRPALLAAYPPTDTSSPKSK